MTVGDLRCGERDSIAERAPSPRVVRRIDELEREAITQALSDTRGNKKEAARRLGVSRRALYRRNDKFGLNRLARAA